MNLLQPGWLPSEQGGKRSQVQDPVSQSTSLLLFRTYAEASSVRFFGSVCLQRRPAWRRSGACVTLPDVKMSASMTRMCVFQVPNVDVVFRSSPRTEWLTDRLIEQAHYPTRDKLQKRVLVGLQFQKKNFELFSPFELPCTVVLRSNFSQVTSPFLCSHKVSLRKVLSDNTFKHLAGGLQEQSLSLVVDRRIR